MSRAYPVDAVNGVLALLNTNLATMITTINTERSYTGSEIIPAPTWINTKFKMNQYPEIIVGTEGSSEYIANESRPAEWITEIFNIFVGYRIKGDNAYMDKWMYGYKEAIERVVNNQFISGITNILVTRSVYTDSSQAVDNDTTRVGAVYFRVQIN